MKKSQSNSGMMRAKRSYRRVMELRSRSTHSREALLSLPQSLLRLGVPEGVNVTGASPGSVYIDFILVAIVGCAQAAFEALQGQFDASMQEFPAMVRYFAGIERDRRRHSAEVVTQFRGNRTEPKTRNQHLGTFAFSAGGRNIDVISSAVQDYQKLLPGFGTLSLVPNTGPGRHHPNWRHHAPSNRHSSVAATIVSGTAHGRGTHRRLADVEDGSAIIRVDNCRGAVWGVVAWEKEPGRDKRSGRPTLGKHRC